MADSGGAVMDGTSTNPSIGWEPWPGANAANGMRWWNPQTNDWQPEMPPPQVTCAANPPPTFAAVVNIGGGAGDLGGYLPCGCYGGPWWGINPPPRCAMHGGLTFVPVAPTTTTTTLTLQPPAQPLSDADVERIARRSAELVLDALRDRLPPRVTHSVRPEFAIDDESAP